MTPYRLGILAMYLSEQRLEELSYFRKLSTYGHKLGIQILVFTPDDVDKNKKNQSSGLRCGLRQMAAQVGTPSRADL